MPAVSDTKYLVQCGWDQVPHLSEAAKKELMLDIEPHLVDARTKGVPSLGRGAVYPLGLESIKCDPFAIPPYWPRAYGFDVGWNRTAAIWGAIDPSADVLYLYAEHYRGQAEPSVHSAAIKARGEWIPGVIDPAARHRGQRDGQQLLAAYNNQGLNLGMAINAREAGVYEVWRRLSTQRLRVFFTLQNWIFEYQLYRRNDKGAIVDEYDHLMDATRYLVMSGLKIAKIAPVTSTAVFAGDLPADRTAGY